MELAWADNLAGEAVGGYPLYRSRPLPDSLITAQTEAIVHRLDSDLDSIDPSLHAVDIVYGDKVTLVVITSDRRAVFTFEKGLFPAVFNKRAILLKGLFPRRDRAEIALLEAVGQLFVHPTAVTAADENALVVQGRGSTQVDSLLRGREDLVDAVGRKQFLTHASALADAAAQGDARAVQGLKTLMQRVIEPMLAADFDAVVTTVCALPAVAMAYLLDAMRDCGRTDSDSRLDAWQGVLRERLDRSTQA